MRKKDAAKANAAYAQVISMFDRTTVRFATTAAHPHSMLAAEAAASAVKSI
jgi:hypothetical protein